MNERNYVYISSGLKNAMYTLREIYTAPDYRGVDKKHDMYLGNLSTDYDTAVKKAVLWSENQNIPFVESVEFDLNGISRLSKEEAERLAEAREKEEKAQHEAMIKEAEGVASQFELTKVWPVGKYSGCALDALPFSYIDWLKHSYSDFIETQALYHLCKYLEKNGYFDYEIPEPDADLKICEVKERRDFNVTVVNSFGFNGHYGWTNVVTMVDNETSACLHHMGSFTASVGDIIKIKATVKGHKRYEGQMQTQIKNVKLLEEIGRIYGQK